MLWWYDNENDEQDDEKDDDDDDDDNDDDNDDDDDDDNDDNDDDDYNDDDDDDDTNAHRLFTFCQNINKKLDDSERDSERELSLRRHCTRTKNTLDSCINSATDRFLQRKITKFSEITQCNGHLPFKVIQGHRFWYQSKAHMRLPTSD